MAKTARPDPPSDPCFDDQQGTEYAAYIHAELVHEHDRRKALHARAQSLITTSTALLAFMGAIAVFAQFAQRYLIAWWLQGLFGIAMLALIVAVGCGIWAGRSYVYQVADETTLAAMVEEHWADDAVDSRNVVASLRVAGIVSLQRGNNAMAWFLLLGQWAQLAFLVLFAIAALLTITSAERIADLGPVLK
jgi:hypothetical protein